MGKLREVGGFKGQGTKQRHSLVMKVLPPLRFRVHDSGQVFKLSKHWETTKSGYPIVSDSNKNCSPVSGSSSHCMLQSTSFYCRSSRFSVVWRIYNISVYVLYSKQAALSD